MECGALICSVNRALLGEVGPHLRAVDAKVDGRTIRLRFFIDGEPTENDVESASCAAAEVISDFPDYELDDQVTRRDYPELLRSDGSWIRIFQRTEDLSS